MTLPPLPDVPRADRSVATRIALGSFAVLCLLGLGFGLKGLFAAPSAQGPPPAPSAAAGLVTDPPPGQPSSPAPSQQTSSTEPPLELFMSPSGNIRCVIDTDGVRCDISARSWQPPPAPPDCLVAYGSAISLDADGASFLCAGDTLDRGEVLRYGQTRTAGDYRCESSISGMQCANTVTGRGFSLAKSSYRLD